MPSTETGVKKKCPRCDEIKDLIEFQMIKISKWKLGVYPYCKPCCRDIRMSLEAKKWGKSPESKAKRKISHQRYIEKYPEKRAARVKLNDYKRTYAYLRGKKCTICGSEKSIQAHHPDYNHPLQVVFLCHDCHVKLHIEEKN
jgi:hypothetical protein